MESVDLDVAESSDGAEPPHLDVQPRAESGESQPAQGCILGCPLGARFSVLHQKIMVIGMI